jgi:hypothetical protein
MSNAKTITRAGDIAGLLGSLVILATFVLSMLFPSNDFPSAPIIGTGALLLLANVVGLLLQRRGRPEALSMLFLTVTMVGLAIITLYAVLDTLANMGIGPTDTDGYWTVLVIALLLTILGLTLYAITASIGAVFPSWVALPLAFSGVLLLLSVPVVAMGVPNIPLAVHDFINTLSLILMMTFFALWGLMSAMGLRSSSVGTPTSSGLSPSRHIPT